MNERIKVCTLKLTIDFPENQYVEPKNGVVEGVFLLFLWWVMWSFGYQFTSGVAPPIRTKLSIAIVTSENCSYKLVIGRRLHFLFCFSRIDIHEGIYLRFEGVDFFESNILSKYDVVGGNPNRNQPVWHIT